MFNGFSGSQHRYSAMGYDDAPELAPQSFPEVAQHPQHQQQAYPLHQYQNPASEPALKPEVYHGHQSPGVYSDTPAGSPYPPSALPATDDTNNKSRKGLICGCTTLVFILSLIIGLLSAAVIGLAAGVGVEAHRASDAETKLAAVRASPTNSTGTPTSTSTSSSANATPTSWNDLDRGCSNDPQGVTGSTYSSFPGLGNLTFTIFCNKDAPGGPYMALFASNFDTCMDACASYSMYTPKTFPNSNLTTCGGVSFIPLWTTKADAAAGGAPGNCYLKPLPQTVTGLSVPNAGTEVHAAILRGGS